MTLPTKHLQRLCQAVALLGAGLVLTTGCREPPPQEQLMPEPVRDPSWRDPSLQESGLPAASTTTRPEDSAPVQLAPAAAFTEPPEPATQVMASVNTYELGAFGLVADLPLPVTAMAAGMGSSESWIYIRSLRGAAYNLEVRIDHKDINSLAELEAAASEIGERPLAGSGTSAGRWWVQKAVEGPVQEWWVALPQPPTPTLPHGGQALQPRPSLEPAPAGRTLVAVCIGPPAYEAVLRRACLTLHREGAAAPPPWDATLTTTN